MWNHQYFDSRKNTWNENGNRIKDIFFRFIAKLKIKINLRFFDKFSKYFENWVRIDWSVREVGFVIFVNSVMKFMKLHSYNNIVMIWRTKHFHLIYLFWSVLRRLLAGFSGMWGVSNYKITCEDFHFYSVKKKGRSFLLECIDRSCREVRSE